MKTKLLVLAAVLFASLCLFSCSDDVEVDDTLPYTYSCHLMITDAEGKDLIREIDVHPYVQGGPLSENQLIVWESAYKLLVNNIEAIIQPLIVGTDSNPHSLSLSSVLWLKHDESSQARTLSYHMTCPQLFGDDQEHQIIVHWDGTLNTEFYEENCSRVEIDGTSLTKENNIFKMTMNRK